MRARSLMSIFSDLNNQPANWQSHIDSAFADEFYRKDIDTCMRKDLKTEDQWKRHALALSKGEAHIYSYTIGYGGNQVVHQELHPYTGCLGHDKQPGHEIQVIIHGALPEPGSLCAHVTVEFRDVYNKMETNVAFFGNDLVDINETAANWCKQYFEKCYQGNDAIDNCILQELVVPYARHETVLGATSSKHSVQIFEHVKLHFEERSNNFPQDANPCITFEFHNNKKFERDSKCTFQVRVAHLKI